MDCPGDIMFHHGLHLPSDGLFRIEAGDCYCEGSEMDDCSKQENDMRQVLFSICIIALLGCTRGSSGADTIVDTSSVDTISFFGNTLELGDSTHIMQQIKNIAGKDSMLSIDGKVLTVVEVGFGINLHNKYVALISSTQVDDPKMKTVVTYLNGLYGIASEGEPNNYLWCKGNTIRLRPLHSEDGGTVIIFN